MKRIVCGFIFLTFFYSVLPLHPKALTYSNLLPSVEVKTDSVVIKARTSKPDQSFVLYYRTEGLQKYQVRKMKRDEQGNIYYQLPTHNLYGKNLEYFIVEYRPDSQRSDSLTPIFTIGEFTPEESPEIYFQEMPETSGATPQREPLARLNGSLSTAVRIHDSAEYPGESFTANGNLRVYKNVVDNENQFDFDANLTYMNQVSEAESNLDLSSLIVRFKKDDWKVEAGDLSISNTDFTTSFLNRRGFQYELSSQMLYVNSFYVNSQQKTHFEGFGIPPGSGSIFGAVLGLHKDSFFKIRGLFMTGKDSLDSKTVISTDEAYREGSMFSLWAELWLLKNHLQLRGEYAQSNFGTGPDSGSVAKEKDNAWRAGFNFNYGILSANADYKKVGSQFNSIANLFLQNDREGLDGNVMVNIKSFSVAVTYRDQKSYLNSPVQPMLHSKNLTGLVNWLIANHLQLGAEYGIDNLDYDESTGLQTGGTDMDTVKYAGTVGYIAGSNSITVRLGKTESRTFTSNIDGSLALSLRFGQVLTFNPSFSYQSTENFTDSSTSKIYNVYLNSELSFIPELFSLSILGSYTKTDNTYSDSTSLLVNGNLNFYMAKLFNYKVQPSLSLKTSYQQNEYSGTKTDSLAIYLQADISF